MRCFTVLLACGWLMFAPPVGYQPDDPVELRRWKFVQGFDNAHNCTYYVTNAVALLRGQLDKYPEHKRTTQEILGRLLIAQHLTLGEVANAKCVPSDAIGFKLK